MTDSTYIRNQEQMNSPRHVESLQQNEALLVKIFFSFQHKSYVVTYWLSTAAPSWLSSFMSLFTTEFYLKCLGTKATCTDMSEVNSFVDLGVCSQSPLSPLCFLSTHYVSLWQIVMAVFDLSIGWLVQAGQGRAEGYREQIFNFKNLCYKIHNNFQVKRTSSFSKWVF